MVYTISIEHVSKMIEKSNPHKKRKHLSTSQAVQPIDLTIRIKAAEWGEEDDHVQYLKEIREE